jgi:hypothetical protein
MSEQDFILEDNKLREHFNSFNKNNTQSIMSESDNNFQSEIATNKKDEKLFLRQFNTDFEKYKSYIKDTTKKSDSIEEENLNRINNIPDKYLTFPYDVYTRFPMIIGIILIIFGIMICLFRRN